MNITQLAAVAGAAALLLPGAALAKGGPGGPHGQSDALHGKADTVHGKAHQQHGHNQTRNVILKGAVVSVDAAAKTAVVHVTRANHHGQAMVGSDVTVDLSAAKVDVADVNADGAADLADVTAADHVLVQVRIPRQGPAPAGLPARRLVDQTARADAEQPETPAAPAQPTA